MIPYEDTKVPVMTSISGVQANLQKLGFTGFGSTFIDNRWTVFAQIGNITFRWDADIKGICKKFSESRTSGADLDPKKAERIAWRAINWSVEAQVKNILCGATSIAQEFGALAIGDGGKTLATMLGEQDAKGNFKSPSVKLLTGGR